METPTKNPTLAELSIQHKQVFSFPASNGIVITLKRIGFLDREKITSEICSEDPEYENSLEKLMNYLEILEDQAKLKAAWMESGSVGEEPIDFPEDLKPELKRVRGIVSKYNHRSFGPCFISPPVNTKEELDTIIDNLENDEKNALVSMLITLSSGLKDIDKNKTVIGIAKKYGIPWTRDLFLTNMTLQQFQVMMKADKEETEAANEILAAMRK